MKNGMTWSKKCLTGFLEMSVLIWSQLFFFLSCKIQFESFHTDVSRVNSKCARILPNQQFQNSTWTSNQFPVGSCLFQIFFLGSSDEKKKFFCPMGWFIAPKAEKIFLIWWPRKKICLYIGKWINGKFWISKFLGEKSGFFKSWSAHFTSFHPQILSACFKFTQCQNIEFWKKLVLAFKS